MDYQFKMYKMKKLVGFLFLAIFISSLFSCKKNDTAPSGIQNDPNNPSMTIDGTTIKLNGISKVFSSSLRDSLIITNSNTFDTLAFNSVSIGDRTTINYSVILLTSAGSALKVGTYTSDQATLTNLIQGVQYQNLYYTGGATSTSVLPGLCTVNILTLTNTSISGTYSGTVYNSNGGFGLLTKTVTGSFKASF